MNHTPTPWAADGTVIEQKDDLLGDGIARCFGANARANAAHIVKCVNAHDELVAAAALVAELVTALKRAERALAYGNGAIVPGDLVVVRAALAKAEAERISSLLRTTHAALCRRHSR